MEATAQREVDLYNNASASLRQGGYNATPESVNPNPQNPLEGIKEALGEEVHIIGGEIEAKLKGKTPDTYIEVSPAKRFSQWVMDRIRRKQK